MIKWLILFFLAVPRILYSQIRLLYINHHKDKYSLQYRYNMVRKTIMWINKFLRTRPNITNLDIITSKHENGRIYVANHNHIYDIMALICLSSKPLIFVSKIENFKVPFLSAHLKAIDGLGIDRNDLKQSLKICKEAGLLAKSGHDIVLFAEGTRSKDGNVQPFKAAISSLVFYANVETVLICMHNTKKPLAFHWFIYPKVPINIKIFEPLSYEYFLENRKEFPIITHDIIQEQLDKFKELQEVKA